MFKIGKDRLTNNKIRISIPLLPLRDIVVFPHMVAPLFVGRKKSIEALENAVALDKQIFLSTQMDAKLDEPEEKDIFTVGTLGSILQLLRLPDGTVKVLVEGKGRGQVTQFLPNKSFFLVEVERLNETAEEGPEVQALMRSANSTFETYAKLNRKLPPEVLMSVTSIEDASKLADTIASHLAIKIEDRQRLLEVLSPTKRLERVYELMRGEIEIMQIEQRIKTRVKKQMEKTQREYYLSEQMRAIQKEMGEKFDQKNELRDLEKKIRRKKMSKEAKAKVQHELAKLKMMSPMSAEATVVRNYIDWLVSLPWSTRTKDKLDIEEAQKILDDDHYGLEKPKQRILEYLAVQSLVKKIKGPILCLVGPPGVGKTSLAKGVARATGRNFLRLSLGGVRDEAEIRGHRRTYIGAMPGKIIQSCARPRATTRSSASMRSIRCPPTSAATPRPPCWRSWTPSRTSPSTTTTSTSTTTCPRSCLSPRPTRSTPSPCPSRTAWRSFACPATPRTRSRPSPSASWCPSRRRPTG